MRLSEFIQRTRQIKAAPPQTDYIEEDEWPQPKGWEFLGPGWAGNMAAYQEYSTGAIFHVDTQALEDGKDANWEVMHWGEKLTGKVKFQGLEAQLKKLVTQLPKVEEKAKKALKVPSGWKFVGWAGSGDITWTRKLPNDPTALSATLTGFDVDDFMNGAGIEFVLSVDDDGGYRTRNIREERITLNRKNYLSKIKSLDRKLDTIQPLAVG